MKTEQELRDKMAKDSSSDGGVKNNTSKGKGKMEAKKEISEGKDEVRVKGVGGGV